MAAKNLNTNFTSIQKPTNHRFTDLTGQTFERLFVESFAGVDQYKESLWLCLCNCGNRKIIRRSNLKRGLTTSCGCYNLERTIETQVTHGHSKNKTKSRELMSWQGTKARCSNPKATGYSNYGGRGITMCDRWKNSFSAFLEDMGPRPTGCTLERVDNNGNYEPGNCAWIPKGNQSRNQRKSIRLTYKETTLVLKQWMRAINRSRLFIKSRLKKGETLENIITLDIANGKLDPVEFERRLALELSQEN